MSDALLLHLSDLHLCQPKDVAPPDTIRTGLLAAIKQVVDGTHNRIAVAVTGDLIDSSTTSVSLATKTLSSLVDDIAALTRGGPIVLLPGNHDRRAKGLKGPWKHDLVAALRVSLENGDRQHIKLYASDALEPLAFAVDTLSEALGAKVIAYDTSHTLSGKYSAGGLFRSEDLLAHHGLHSSKVPVVVLLHHHLIPTPVTDASNVDVARGSIWERTIVDAVLPALVTFADREELFMTALGAGTALSLLHELNAPVIALHGHKHYPAARLLRALRDDEGDVLLASAGSAGLREPYRGGPSGARLRPSFNAVWFEGDRVRMETVFFSAKGKKDLVRQTVADVVQRGSHWEPSPAPMTTLTSLDLKPTTQSDRASFTIKAREDDEEFFDYTCVRRVDGAPTPYDERIEPAPGATFVGADVKKTGDAWLLHIRSGVDVTYDGTRALCRTSAASRKRWGAIDFSPYEWVWLDVRGGTKHACLELHGVSKDTHVFGSVTDLHTGRQHPCDVQRDGDGPAVLKVDDCPAKRLLRIYWPLDAKKGNCKRRSRCSRSATPSCGAKETRTIRSS